MSLSSQTVTVASVESPPATRPSWRRFLVWRLPLAMLAILIGGQALAHVLRRIPLRRSYMDDLALAVELDRTPHRVVLLGDSITLLSTRHFQLGKDRDDVINLATIAWTGAAAELFLLQRYLANHPAPDYIVYAAAPDDLQNNDSPQLVHYYDWNVYSRPEERSFMRQYIPGVDARERLPAVLNVQENIIERLTSLLSYSAPSIASGAAPPNPDVQPEPASENRIAELVQKKRIAAHLVIGPLQRAVFSRICALGRQYGFKLAIVWPPLPEPVRRAWTERGEFARLDAALADVVTPDCSAGPTFDVNTLRQYANFNRDGFHLHGAGWTERYAADLSAYIRALPDGLEQGAERQGQSGKPTRAARN